MKKIIFARNGILRLIASAVPIFIIQILIFPNLAQAISASIYGFVLTVYSFFSLVPGTLGNALLNVRLVHNIPWGEQSDADFSIMLIFAGILSVLGTVFFFVVYGSVASITTLLICITSVLWLVREYAVAKYLYDLDYVSFMKNSFIMCFGYGVGYCLFCIGGDWALIFLLGQVTSLIYLGTKAKIIVLNRPSKSFKKLTKESFLLVISGGLLRSVTYCDRLILYPLLGGASVAVYYSATLISKIINMIAVAFNSVVLTDLAKKTNDDRHSFFVTLGVSLLICVVCYGMILFTAPVLLGLLYPQFINEALPLVPITGAAALISVVTSLISPYVLRFRSIKWQVISPFVSLVLYLLFTLSFYFKFGLTGFAFGALIAELIKLVVQIGVYLCAN